MLGKKTLKVVACNTILVPPFPEKCAELTLTITSTGDTIVNTTKATETTSAKRTFTWRPTQAMTTANSPDSTTTTATTAATATTTKGTAGVASKTTATTTTTSNPALTATITTTRTVPPFVGRPSTTDVLDRGDRTVLIIVGTILACVTLSGVATIVVVFVRVRRLTAAVNAMKGQGQVIDRPRQSPRQSSDDYQGLHTPSGTNEQRFGNASYEALRGQRI
ncbi:hypothetical protein LSAT2_015898 [Lamellibrachia satsuma]|nr:hypothetical protein LSAT2_015898 [Lamellibrachia satsuma]